jgi:hypothetical protein
MKILITESQYRTLLTEARQIFDLRGKLPSNFITGPNFYVIMSNMGNMLIVNEIFDLTYIYKDREYRGGIEKSEKGQLEGFKNSVQRLNSEINDMVPDEFKVFYDKKVEYISISDGNPNIGAVLYVDVKKKTIQNPITFEYIKDEQKDYKYKTAEYYDPAMVKKTIKDLLAKNIINSKFIYIDVNKEDTTDKRTDYTGDGQFLYHGTTKSNADRIMRIGLRPVDTKDATKDKTSLFRGNSSTLGGYTDKNLYLTPSLDVAKQYAYRQAQYLKDEPVVLKVEIPDMDRLILDDDIIRKYIGPKIHKEAEKKSTYFGEEHKIGYRIFKYKTDWTGDEWIPNFLTYVDLLWRTNFNSLVTKGEYETFTDLFHDDYLFISKEDLIEIKNKFPDSFYEWLKNLVKTYYNEIRHQYFRKSAFKSEVISVAYRGNILPKFITTIPVEYKLKRDI